MKVLIVDDSRGVRDRLRELVTEIDFVCAVAEARDVPEAHLRAHEFAPDVVLLDLRLPGGDGLDVLRSLRSGPAVIVLTSHPTVFHRERCLAEGARHFLDKAKDFERLPELLRALAPGGSAPHGGGACA